MQTLWLGYLKAHLQKGKGGIFMNFHETFGVLGATCDLLGMLTIPIRSLFFLLLTSDASLSVLMHKDYNSITFAMHV